ncbi:hypothetical protein VCHC61A1_3636 [Vibrio cholerae HC-61A1]|nr:hypothetical protein VCHC61A1_3636 [Vibrio cholerae HC-61A1]
MYVHGFRFYFTPLTGVLFAFPSRYWFTIGQSGVFSLGGWSPHIQTGYHVSRLLDFTLDEASVTGLSPCIAKLSSLFTYFTECLRANPGSLAATTGISVDFFSSGYLDVSVPPVCSVNLCIQLTVTAYAVGFPHFGNTQTQTDSYCLICAYRKLVRPSSPLTAQASTVYA